MSNTIYPKYVNTAPAGLATTDDLPEGAINYWFTEGRVVTVIQNSSINEHIDVNISSVSDKQVLSFDISSSTWTPGGVIPTDTDSLPEGLANYYFTNSRLITELASISIDSLLDISINNAIDNDILTYLNGEWVNVSWSLSAFTTTDLTEGDNLYYTDQRVTDWSNQTSIVTFSDVNELVTNNEGDLLRFRSGKWTSEPNSFTINDFIIDSPSTGEYLYWDSNKWIPHRPALKEFTNSASNNQILVYRSNQWTPTTFSEYYTIEISSDITAESNYTYLVDTSSNPITLTLPANPFKGDTITIADAAGSDPSNPSGFGLNPLTITCSPSHTIAGFPDILIDSDNRSLKLIFSLAKSKWLIIQ